jgi:hypothetical protein
MIRAGFVAERVKFASLCGAGPPGASTWVLFLLHVPYSLSLSLSVSAP